MPRRANGWAVVCLTVTVLCVSCAAPDGPSLQVPPSASAVEVRFGDSYCRRIESAKAIGGLIAFAERHRTGWEASWNEPEPPQLTFRLFSDDGEALALGVGEGQLRASFDERSHFQPLSESSRRDLLDRLGGPPTSTPEIPCEDRAPAPPA